MIAAAIVILPAVNTCPMDKIGDCVRERLISTGLLERPPAKEGAGPRVPAVPAGRPAAAAVPAPAPAIAPDTSARTTGTGSAVEALPAVAAGGSLSSTGQPVSPIAGAPTARAAVPAPVLPAGADVAKRATPAIPLVSAGAAPVAVAPALPAPSVAAAPAAPTNAMPLPAPQSPLAAEPSFGLVRAEPDGSLVIAGSAPAGTQVQVFADGTLLGETKAQAGGDWVLVPDQPVASGGVELTLGVAGIEQRAPQSFVVAIDPDRKAEPLVVASTPGQMSAVLQGLPRRTALPSPPAAAIGPDRPPQVTPTATQPLAAEVEPAGSSAVAGAAVSAKAAHAPQVASAPAGPAVTAGSAISQSPLPPSSPVTVEIAATEIAKPSPAGAEPLSAAPAPSIDAIEIDGERNFFAGSGPEGATVRLYVDGRMVGEAKVNGGRWLVEARKALTKSAQPVRLDVLGAGGGKVVARAEVNFVVDIPGASAAASVASSANDNSSPTVAAPPRPLSPLDAGARAAASAGAPLAGAAVAVVAPSAPLPPLSARSQVGIEVGAPPAPRQRDQVGTAAVPAPRPATADGMAATPTGDVARAGEAVSVNQPGAALASINQPMPAVATANQVKVSLPELQIALPTAIVVPQPLAAPQPATGSVAVAKGAEGMPATALTAAAPTAKAVPAEVPPIPTLTAEPVGDPDSGRFAFGKAIIRHGDNLWTIAERAYGSGLRYTTIYQANDDQIRNPRLIYPGQVFDLPNLPGQ